MLDSILADRDLVVDWVKFGTMFAVSRLMAGGALDDQKWMMTCLYTLLGFTAYHIVIKKMVPVNVDNDVVRRVVNTWMKVGTMLVVSRLLSGKELSQDWMMQSVYTILGFNAYDALVQDMVPTDIVENEGLRNAINDGVVVATMSTVSRLLSGGKFDNEWVMSALYTWAGFAAYDLGTSQLLN